MQCCYYACTILRVGVCPLVNNVWLVWCLRGVGWCWCVAGLAAGGVGRLPGPGRLPGVLLGGGGVAVADQTKWELCGIGIVAGHLIVGWGGQTLWGFADPHWLAMCSNRYCGENSMVMSCIV